MALYSPASVRAVVVTQRAIEAANSVSWSSSRTVSPGVWYCRVPVPGVPSEDGKRSSDTATAAHPRSWKLAWSLRPTAGSSTPVSCWTVTSEAMVRAVRATRSPSASDASTTGPGTDEPAWISTVGALPFCRPAIMSIWKTPTIRSPAAAAARA
jgi:hypothetical protein